MTRRFTAQLLAVLMLAFVSIWASTGTAAAADLCLHPPYPASPTGGVSGSIDKGPAPADRVKGDPFVQAPDGKPQPTIYDAYGYAGTKIVRFDDGCQSTFNIWNDFANIGQGATSVLIATTTTFYRTVVSPTFGSLFDGLQKAAQNIIGHGLFLPFIVLVLLAAGVYFLWLAEDNKVKETLSGAGRMGVIVVIGMFAALYPITIGAAIDSTLNRVVSSVSALSSPNDDSHTAADALAGSVQTSITYNTWVQATFGPGELNQKVAREYGPRLFKAAAFTRDEQDLINREPDKEKEIVEAKQKAYSDAATEIRDKYPSVYEYVSGNQQLMQAGFSFVGVIAALIGVAFLLIALVKLGYSMIVVRLAIGATPAIALAAAFPTMAHLAVAAAKVVVDALAKAVFFTVAVLLFVRVGLGGILAPSTNLPWIVKLMLLGLLTYAAWYGAKRFGLMSDIEKAKQAAKRGQERLANRMGDNGDSVSSPTSTGEVFSPTPSGTGTTRPVADVRTKIAPSVGGARTRPEYAMHVTPEAPATTGGAGKAAAIGGAKGGVKGAVQGIAASAATGGAAAPAAAAGAARGAAKGAAASAARHGTSKTVSGRVAFHPTGPDRTAAPGPAKPAPTIGRGANRVHTVHTTKAGAR